MSPPKNARSKRASSSAISSDDRATPGSASPKTPRAIISPTVDFLLAGGLSIIVFVPLLLTGNTALLLAGTGVQAWLGATINMPHFMASYRIVYRDRAMIMRHKWAAIYVPCILVAYLALALWEAQGAGVPLLGTVLVSVASVYLAWHYTGQVWGMMATYAYLSGNAFDPTERRLIRTGLRLLLAWHVCWWAHVSLNDATVIAPLYAALSAGTVVAFVLGALGLFKMKRRTGANPPARAVAAWLAIFAWYAVLARGGLKAIFLVQIAHALQYLSFPLRVEINRAAGTPSNSPSKLVIHMVAYGVILLAVSVVVAAVVPGRAMDIVANMFGEQPGRAAPILILMFINIHHFFTDGVIWKLGNPEVRKELFAHVAKP